MQFDGPGNSEMMRRNRGALSGGGRGQQQAGDVGADWLTAGDREQDLLERSIFGRSEAVDHNEGDDLRRLVGYHELPPSPVDALSPARRVQGTVRGVSSPETRGSDTPVRDAPHTISKVGAAALHDDTITNIGSRKGSALDSPAGFDRGVLGLSLAGVSRMVMPEGGIQSGPDTARTFSSHPPGPGPGPNGEQLYTEGAGAAVARIERDDALEQANESPEHYGPNLDATLEAVEEDEDSSVWVSPAAQRNFARAAGLSEDSQGGVHDDHRSSGDDDKHMYPAATRGDTGGDGGQCRYRGRAETVGINKVALGEAEAASVSSNAAYGQIDLIDTSERTGKNSAVTSSTPSPGHGHGRKSPASRAKEDDNEEEEEEDEEEDDDGRALPAGA